MQPGTDVLLLEARRLVDHFGSSRALDLCDLAFNRLTEPLGLTEALGSKPDPYGHRVSPQAAKSFAARGLAIREYAVSVIGESA